jgi:hypothetical protein
VWQTYLNTNPDSLREFAQTQLQLSRKHKVRNAFTAVLQPFQKSVKQMYKTPTQYDRLPPPRPARLQQATTVCAFSQIDVNTLGFQNYTLAVFVLAAEHAADWTVPAGGQHAWYADKTFAGLGAIFGGRAGCTSCRVRVPFEEVVDVTAALRRQGLDSQTAAVRVYVVDESGTSLPLEDTRIPAPVLRQNTAVLGRTCSQAVERMHTGFVATGVVRYYVGPEPGYLVRTAVLADIEEALRQWGVRVGFTVQCVAERTEATLRIEWDHQTADGVFVFDGAGGVLAQSWVEASGLGWIQLDFAERWGTQAAPGGASHLVLPVVLHEFGHILGVAHSTDADAVMNPFYAATRVLLTDADVATVAIPKNEQEQ